MTTISLFMIALLVSLAGFAYLALTDPKRRRLANAAKQSPVARVVYLGWLVVALPGALLLPLGELSAFVSWLGAITVSGWLLVMILFRDQTARAAREY